MPSEKPLILGEIALLRREILRSNMGFLSSRLRPMCILATLLFLGAVGLAQLVYPQAAQNRGGQNAAPNTNRQACRLSLTRRSRAQLFPRSSFHVGDGCT